MSPSRALAVAVVVPALALASCGGGGESTDQVGLPAAAAKRVEESLAAVGASHRVIACVEQQLESSLDPADQEELAKLGFPQFVSKVSPLARSCLHGKQQLGTIGK